MPDAKSAPRRVINGDAEAVTRGLHRAVAESMQCYLDALDDPDSISGLHRMVMDEVEPALLCAVLDRAGGSRSLAARMLGISRATLCKRLKGYGL